MERLGNLLNPRDQQEEFKRKLALRPSRFSVPDASGCWCLDSEGTNHGKRWREMGEPENAASLRILQQTVYCPCDVGEALYQEALAKVREEREELLLDKRLSVWYEHSGFPLRFTGETPGEGVSLDSSPLSRTSPELVKRLRRTVENQSPESWLFWGDYGCGKTGLAIAYARQFIWPDAPFTDTFPTMVRFSTLPDLLSEMRATYNHKPGEPSEMDVLEKYRNAGLLILDDMGAEQVKDTGWLEDRLYQVIGHRHGDERPIVFTSNLEPQKLGARIGERNMWRIVEMCGEDHIVHVTGPNLRMPR